jgi:hypothetical protein
VHLSEVCRLDWMIGVKAIRDPIVAIVVSTVCYLHFYLVWVDADYSKNVWLVFVEVDLLRSILHYR